jgi:hypothetical protein
VFDFLRSQLDVDIASAHIVISGSQVVLCQGDELIDVVRKGQGVLNLLSLSGVKEDLDATLVMMHDRATASPTAAGASPAPAVARRAKRAVGS